MTKRKKENDAVLEVILWVESIRKAYEDYTKGVISKDAYEAMYVYKVKHKPNKKKLELFLDRLEKQLEKERKEKQDEKEGAVKDIDNVKISEE